jgi:glycoside/pentoside/hexuronide:cation symporter, GPH family
MNTQAMTFGTRQGLHYGLLGLPLAFVALPLYVILPHHYATQFGVPLATLGALLLGARLLDAFIDPLLGKWSDRLFRQSITAVLVFGACAAVLLASGFAALLFPPLREGQALLVWAGIWLVLTYAAYSALSIAHQSWGAMLGGDEAQRARIVGWREGWGLLGVVLASVSPTLWGLPATAMLFAAALAIGWWFWSQAQRPVATARHHPSNLWLPFRRAAFRRLLGVFMLNGIASAVPATLVLFFVQDRLQAPRQLEPAFLGSYFLCAALSLPLWMRAVRRIGLARTWLVGMLLAIAVFVFASRLHAGESMAFLAVCALSGIALGADLALPSALLAGVIADAGDRGQSEGAYFGWWNFATKLNLALAAGLGLPLLALFGYVPGARDAQALQALVVAYCLVPCALKLTAAATLYGLVIRPARLAGAAARTRGLPLDEAR